ncbi:response regulator transcription factor [Spirochaeta dissipatitropha]
MASILVVEDNQSIREAVVEYLKLDGHNVHELSSGEGVIESVNAGGLDLLVLDVMLPKISGFALAREIRRTTTLPIIFLTARDEESDRIVGFELGADDYIVKPFSPKELVLRVQAILRRVNSASGGDCSDMLFENSGGELRIDTEAHQVSLNSISVPLTSTEWELLIHLAEHNGQVFSREALLQTCLGYSAEGTTRTVDTHIGNIRNKMSAGDTSGHDWIETIRGYGYRFNGEKV